MKRCLGLGVGWFGVSRVDRLGASKCATISEIASIESRKLVRTISW